MFQSMSVDESRWARLGVKVGIGALIVGIGALLVAILAWLFPNTLSGGSTTPTK
jgi:hypothetical protein